MHIPKQNPKFVTSIIASLTYFLLVSLVKAQTNGQVSTPCTSSMISTFTPCMNYITGSTANGRSNPSSDCCNALKSVMAGSMDCACLMITGGVPLPQIVNSTLGLGLPNICGKAGISLQCTPTGVPLPPPGPLQFGAPPPPSSATSPQASGIPTAAPAPGPLQFGAAPSPRSDFSPQASKATESTPVSEPRPMELELPPVKAPSSAKVEPPSKHPRIRPVMVIPSSDSSVYKPITTTTTIWAFFMGFMLLKL